MELVVTGTCKDMQLNANTQNWLTRPPVWYGAVHKVRYARGGGCPRRCDSLRQGEGGQDHVTSRLYKVLSYI